MIHQVLLIDTKKRLLNLFLAVPILTRFKLFKALSISQKREAKTINSTRISANNRRRSMGKGSYFDKNTTEEQP